jgi:phasin family protein
MTETTKKTAAPAQAAKPEAKVTRAPSKPGEKKPGAVAAPKAKTAPKAQSKPKPAAPKAASKPAAKKASPAPKPVAAQQPTSAKKAAKPAVKSAPKKTQPKAAAPKAAAKTQVQSAPQPAARTLESKTMNETIENVTAASSEALKEGFEKTLSAVNQANDFQKDNVDAVIASATAAGKGMEAINTAAVSYVKTAMKNGVATAKAVTTAKSVQEMVEIQADFVKTAMDAYLGEVNKSTELMASTMKDTVKPLNERFSASVEIAQSLR